MQPNWQRFDFRSLQLYCELGRLGSIREVARVHRLDPSRISRLVAAFETQYRTKLVERSAEGVRYTEHGLAMKTRFESILTAAHLGLAEVAPAASSLAIAATAFLCTRVVAPLVAKVTPLLPDLRFRLMDFAPDELVAHGIQGAFEGAVHIGRLDWPRAWVSTEAGRLTWQLFARSKHPLARRKHVTVDELRRFRFTQPVYWTRGKLELGNDHCPLPRAERTAGTSTSTADAAIAVIRDNDELAFLPEILCREEVTRGILSPIRVRGWPAIHNPLFATFRSDAVTVQFLRQFVALLARILGRA